MPIATIDYGNVQCTNGNLTQLQNNDDDDDDNTSEESTVPRT